MAKLTKEQKVAHEIMAELDRLKIDLDEVGRYIGRQDNLTYNRLMIVIEAAEEEKQRQELSNHTRLF
jgi:hypothetical protein